MLTRLLLSCFFVAGLIPSLRASPVSLFNFDNQPLSTYTPFTERQQGVNATFTSNGDPGGFALTPYNAVSLSGNVLFEPGPSDLDNLSLIISFDRLISNISLNFAVNGNTSDTVELTAYLGQSQVGDITATGSRPVGAIFPEGLINFGDAPFDRVVVSSVALDFAIDNVRVAAVTAPTPEPGTLSLTGLVMAGGLALFLKRPSSVRP